MFFLLPFCVILYMYGCVFTYPVNILNTEDFTLKLVLKSNRKLKNDNLKNYENLIFCYKSFG